MLQTFVDIDPEECTITTVTSVVEETKTITNGTIGRKLEEMYKRQRKKHCKIKKDDKTKTGIMNQLINKFYNYLYLVL